MLTMTVYVVRDASGEYLTESGGRTPASNEAHEFATLFEAEDACERTSDQALAREVDDVLAQSVEEVDALHYEDTSHEGGFLAWVWRFPLALARTPGVLYVSWQRDCFAARCYHPDGCLMRLPEYADPRWRDEGMCIPEAEFERSRPRSSRERSDSNSPA